MNGDIDETSNSNLYSTSSSSTIQKPQQNNRRRAFFHDDVIVTDNKINDTIEENLSTTPNNNEENQINKSFKRKVVSFSAMPFEKKVADGKKIKNEELFSFFI